MITPLWLVGLLIFMLIVDIGLNIALIWVAFSFGRSFTEDAKP